MNCPRAEEVAMLEPLSIDLREHLAGCSECRELLADLLADQVLLREPPVVAEGVVAARVLCSLSVRRWRMGMPLAAAAAIVLALVWPRVPAPLTLEVVPPAPVVAQVVTPSRPPDIRRALPSKPAVADPEKLRVSLEAMLEPPSTPTASADAPVLITTQTADPDVVIVLVPEKTGEDVQ